MPSNKVQRITCTVVPANIRQQAGDRPRARCIPVVANKTGLGKGGRWTGGQSGNPAGRPTGRRNLSYQHLHELMTAQGEAVVTAVLAAALRGDSIAQRLVLDRILPRRVCNPIRDVTLPPMSTAADAVQALGEVTSAVIEGRITTDEAAALASIVEVFIKVAASHDHERRIVELEERPKAQA